VRPLCGFGSANCCAATELPSFARTDRYNDGERDAIRMSLKWDRVYKGMSAAKQTVVAHDAPADSLSPAQVLSADLVASLRVQHPSYMLVRTTLAPTSFHACRAVTV
jgi:hypothetical protein